MIQDLEKALRSITLSMKAHPDCTEGSEFADMVSIAEKALSGVSEQQKELASLRSELEERRQGNRDLIDLIALHKKANDDLRAENEKLKAMMDVEHCPSLETCCKEAKRCEALEEALKERIERLRDLNASSPDGRKIRNGEIDFIKSLLDKVL